MANSTTLMSLALLKVNMDSQQSDYVDYLRPFVTESLRKHKPSPIQDADVAGLILSDFGLKIPAPAVQLVLRRLARLGVLQRRNSTYELKADIPDSNFPELQSMAQRKIEALLRQLRDYAASTFKIEWSDEDAIKSAILYLSEFAIECLRTYILDTAIPDVPQRSDRDLKIVHSFVRDELSKSDEGFENLITLVKGHMLANALLCRDVQSLQQKFERVTFYLDTPLVLRALGMAASAQHLAALELLQVLRSLRGRLAIFEHTKVEIVKVLKAAEENFHRTDSAPRSVRELRMQGKGPSDIALLRGQLERQLAALGINIKRTPAHVKEFQIDESVLEGVIEEEISYQNSQARLHDVECIRSIFTLRKGKAPVRLEDAEAVFVTTNTPLAKKAYEYGRQFEHSREVSSVVTDFSLANVAWLKAPMAAPNLPEREIIAACYAALQPPVELWKKYLGEVDSLRKNNLISEADLAFLRNDAVAREELMNLTLGETAEFTPETVPEILERVKNEVLAEEREKSNSLAQALGRLRMERNDQIRHAYKLAQYAGQLVALLVAFVLVAGLIFASGLIPKTWLGSLPHAGVAAGIGVLITVGLTIGVAGAVFGWSIMDYYRGLQRGVAGAAYKQICKFMKLPLSESDEEPDAA